jgi:LDH2 family malate/lactate/ureidoglycolate dehydrogenase
MIDRSGKPLTDPLRVTEGSLLPAGGYKGYGLAFMFGLLASTLNGGAFGRSVVDFNADSVTATNTGHTISAIDIASFADAAFKAQVDAVCDEIRNSAQLPGAPPIRIPGESSATARTSSLRTGIGADEDLLAELNQLAADCGCRPIEQD